MKTTVLLAIVLSIAFATASLAGPRQGDTWKPCAYGDSSWRIDGTDCG